MADKKISQLTAATTPLAGTEVLPIVQGGSTVKVSAADITAGRAISASGLTLSGGTANGVVYLDGSKVATTGTGLVYTTTGLGIGASPSYKLDIRGTTDTSYFNVTSTADANGTTLRIGTDATAAFINATGGSSGTLQLRTYGTTRATVDSSGNVNIANGNLVVGTAGKGIDFSANSHAAGMTSELLNWYEEGTYTPTLTCGTSGTITLNTSFDTLGYTRIGRMVYVHGYISASSVSSPTGELRLSIPFTTCTTTQVGERGPWGTGAISIAGSASSVANGFQIVWSDNKAYVVILVATGNGFADAAAQIQGSNNTDIRVGFWYPCSA